MFIFNKNTYHKKGLRFILPFLYIFLMIFSAILFVISMISSCDLLCIHSNGFFSLDIPIGLIPIYILSFSGYLTYSLIEVQISNFIDNLNLETDFLPTTIAIIFMLIISSLFYYLIGKTIDKIIKYKHKTNIQ